MANTALLIVHNIGAANSGGHLDELIAVELTLFALLKTTMFVSHQVSYQL